MTVCEGCKQLMNGLAKYCDECDELIQELQEAEEERLEKYDNDEP